MSNADAEENGNGFDFDFSLSGTGHYLTINVGSSVLELLPMGDLPARKVMGLLSSKQADRLEAALELMKLASKHPGKFENEAEFISFDELIAALDLWMDKSSDYSTGHRESLISDGRTIGSSMKFGFGGLDNGRSGVRNKKASMSISAEAESEEIALELAEAIAEAIEEASHIYHKANGELEDMSEEQVILAVAMWFVKEGRQDELIKSGLLSPKSRTGKYYPIIDKKVSRRFGFTEEEAKEWKKWQ